MFTYYTTQEPLVNPLDQTIKDPTPSPHTHAHHARDQQNRTMMGMCMWGWGWILYGLVKWVDQRFLGGVIARFWYTIQSHMSTQLQEYVNITRPFSPQTDPLHLSTPIVI
jgi:hypothetical protein